MFFDTMSDFNVPGSRPQKHDEISEIGRKVTYVASDDCQFSFCSLRHCLSNAANLICEEAEASFPDSLVRGNILHT